MYKLGVGSHRPIPFLPQKWPKVALFGKLSRNVWIDTLLILLQSNLESLNELIIT